MAEHQQTLRFPSFKGLGIKAVLVCLLSLFLLIPLLQINSILQDRGQTRHEAVSRIMTSWGKPQHIIGPVIELPYIKQVHVGDTGGWSPQKAEIGSLFITPDTFGADVSLQVQERTVGIFTQEVYTAAASLQAVFEPLSLLPEGIRAESIVWEDARILFSVYDITGLDGTLAAAVNGESRQASVAGMPYDGARLEFPLGGTLIDTPATVEIGLELRGSHDFDILPIGARNTIDVQSDWSSPGFTGRYAPKKQEISDTGFKASWDVIGISAGVTKFWPHFPESGSASFVTVDIVNPVDTYRLTERSIKYGILFIVLTFSVLYLFEVRSHRQIHPVQYGLIGLALCLFFLSLLSLAEHIAFWSAFSLSALVVIMMNCLYGMVAIGDRAWVLGLGLVQTVLFGFLYGTLRLEDSALLGGTTLLFLALASAMYITRNVNWYGTTGAENDQ